MSRSVRIHIYLIRQLAPDLPRHYWPLLQNHSTNLHKIETADRLITIKSCIWKEDDLKWSWPCCHNKLGITLDLQEIQTIITIEFSYHLIGRNIRGYNFAQCKIYADSLPWNTACSFSVQNHNVFWNSHSTLITIKSC